MAMLPETIEEDFIPVDFDESTDLVNEGKAVVTLSFSNAVSVSYIRFTNSYTAAMTLSCFSEAEQHWVDVQDAFELMPYPHFIDGAQDGITIEIAKTSNPAAFENITRLRLLLTQPSPHWLKFGINDLVCFARRNDTLITPKALEEQLSREIEQLHSLVTKATTLVRAHAKEYDRFEVNGQYEIKTLVVSPE
eukprot:m.198894 g.198894  ORF g.198894 m.198894 type:complete len:192 (+) comp18766_c0_seq5:821-1396(+)